MLHRVAACWPAVPESTGSSVKRERPSPLVDNAMRQSCTASVLRGALGDHCVTAQSQHTAEWHSRLWSVWLVDATLYISPVVSCAVIGCTVQGLWRLADDADSECGNANDQLAQLVADIAAALPEAESLVAQCNVRTPIVRWAQHSTVGRATVRSVMSIGSQRSLVCCAHRPASYAHTPIT